MLACLEMTRPRRMCACEGCCCGGAGRGGGSGGGGGKAGSGVGGVGGEGCKLAVLEWGGVTQGKGGKEAEMKAQRRVSGALHLKQDTHGDIELRRVKVGSWWYGGGTAGREGWVCWACCEEAVRNCSGQCGMRE